MNDHQSAAAYQASRSLQDAMSQGRLGAEQPKAQSELEEVLDRLYRAWTSLRNENCKLRDRLESVTRPAAPSAVGNSVKSVEPVRSTLGTNLYDTANEMFAEADNVRSLIDRLAV